MKLCIKDRIRGEGHELYQLSRIRPRNTRTHRYSESANKKARTNDVLIGYRGVFDDLNFIEVKRRG